MNNSKNFILEIQLQKKTHFYKISKNYIILYFIVENGGEVKAIFMCIKIQAHFA